MTAVRGKEIGWAPKYEPDHIFELVDEEVDLILTHI
jgi:hypothetical protein